MITDGIGLNITVMSYCGHLDFGIVADREQMPDVWSLIDWLARRSRSSSRGRSSVRRVGGSRRRAATHPPSRVAR